MSTSHLSHDQGLWRSLLEWLQNKHGMKVDPTNLLVECRDAPGAGKGLFVLQDCQKSSTLFTVPANALVNVKTLGSHYPPASDGLNLSAVQMISLHLLLHKPHEDGVSRDELFGPYISTMPRSFESHPCTWKLKARLASKSGTTAVSYADTEASLLEALPPSAKRSISQLASRLWTDWETVCQYARSNPAIVTTASRSLSQEDFSPENSRLVHDYIWAWLNVNTRCIHYRVSPTRSSPDNITLCPILDFANHSPRPHSDIVAVLPQHTLGGAYVFKSSAEHTLHTGHEIFLRYGGHANRTLFTEYGFVNLWEDGAVEMGSVEGEADVQDFVEDMIERAGGRIAAIAREVLEDEGYWGDWTIHSSPAPAHPSYRLITALRLLCLLENRCALDTAAIGSHTTFIDNWRNVIQGEADMISDDNEKHWRTAATAICEGIIQRAEVGVERVKSLTGGSEKPEWLCWMKKNIALLWQEELEVAKLVLRSLQSGEEF